MSDAERQLPILCLDFDGVIHQYSKGWSDGTIYDGVVPGFFDWAVRAKNYFTLVIYSSRSKTLEGRELMREWISIQEYQWLINKNPDSGAPTLRFEFASEKPPAWLTIDDRCITFRGDWCDPLFAPESLIYFRTWTQRPSLPEAPQIVDTSLVPEEIKLREEIAAVLNKYAVENGSNTPDFVLSEYLLGCLAAFDKAVGGREAWYGRLAPTGNLWPAEQTAAEED